MYLGTLPLTENQAEALRRVSKQRRSIVPLGCGEGKSRIACEVMNAHPGRILIVAPPAVALGTWPEELAKWLTPGWAGEVTVSSNDYRAIGKHAKTQFDGVVIDELTAFKNPTSNRTKLLNHIADRAHWVIGLTGTLTGNGYPDLWPQVRLVRSPDHNPLCRTLTDFRATFLYPLVQNGHVVYKWGVKDKNALLSRIRPFTAFPAHPVQFPKEFVDVPVALPTASIKRYKEFAKTAVLEYGDDDLYTPDHGTAPVIRGKLRQLSEGFIYLDPEAGDEGAKKQCIVFDDTKIEEAARIAEDGPLIIFYGYKPTRDRLLKAIPGSLAGAENAGAWNSGKCKCLILHPLNGGYGLNLQAGGHRVLWMSPPDSMEQYIQGNARVARNGQKADSSVIMCLLAEHTLDKHVKNNILGGKLNVLQEAADFLSW